MLSNIKFLPRALRRWCRSNVAYTQFECK